MPAFDLQKYRQLADRRERLIGKANAMIQSASKHQRAMTKSETDEFTSTHQTAEELRAEMEVQEAAAIKSGRWEMRSGVLCQRDLRRAGEEDTPHRDNRRGRDDLPGLIRSDPHFDDPDRQAFRAWLSGGPNAVPDELRGEMQQAMTRMSNDQLHQVRAMTTATPSLGGYTVPQSFFRILEVAMADMSGMLGACDYWDTEDGTTAPVPMINDTGAAGELVAEGSPVSVDVDPVVSSVNLATHMYSSKVVKLSIQLTQDSAFQIEQTIAELLAMRITRALVPHLTTGDGDSKPRGILTDATLGKLNFPATTIGYADLIDLEHSVDRAYRNPTNPKVGYMMHDSTLGMLRKLTDDDNTPIFRSGSITDGLATNRAPDTLNGWPIFLNASMPQVGAGNKTVLFGDFSKYLVRRVRSLVIFRFDQLFMQNLQLGLLAFGRFGGLLRDAGSRPVKYLQQGAS